MAGTDTDLKIMALQARLDELQRLVAEQPGQLRNVVLDTFEELQSSLEELQVLDEELRVQNEDLAAARLDSEREARRYGELFNFAPDGYLVTDSRGVIQEANRAAAVLLSADQQRLVGLPLSAFVASRDIKAFMNGLTRLLRTREIYEWELAFEPQGGRPFPAAVSVAMAVDERRGLTTLRWLIRDVTERKRAEEQVESLARFPGENPSPIMRLSREGAILYANAASLPLLAMWGREVGQAVPEDWRERVARATESQSNEQAEITCADRIFAITFAPIAKGGYVNVYGLDITERKRAEDALRDSERFLSNIFSSIQDGLCVIDKDFNLVRVNPVAERWYAHRMPLVGKKCHEAIRGRDEICEDCPSQRSLENRGTHVGVYPKIGPEGTQVGWLENYAFPLVDEGTGEMKGVIAYARDITERKRAEEAVAAHVRLVEDLNSKLEISVEEMEVAQEELKVQNEDLLEAQRRIEELAQQEQQRANWLATILDQMPAGVVILASDGRRVLANRAAGELWGSGAVPDSLESYGASWRVLGPDGAPLPLEKTVSFRALRGEAVTAEERILVRADGNHMPTVCSSIPLFEDGVVTGAVVVSWDETVQKEAHRKLEEASRLKDEFLAAASEALKTPVTSVEIFSQLAASHPEAIQPQLVQRLLAHTDRLVSLVNTLLDVSRLQLGRMPIERRRVDLSRLIAEACLSFEQQPLLACLEVKEAVVQGDGVRLAQVFTNLLDNALKHSRQGGKTWVRLSRQDDGKAVVEVKDQGAGIPPERLPRIFERSLRPGGGQGGTGLGVGLYLCKEIVERHGGRIWAESEPGVGSSFFVELPLAENEGLSAGN
jgi:PAS domain S-box-containing protein